MTTIKNIKKENQEYPEGMDITVIPPGEYCYRIRKIEPGEILSTDVDRYGKDLREYSYHKGYKSVLCPYWKRTDYGTVRCNFMDYEALDDEDPKARELAIAYFNDEKAPDRFERSWLLPDEIKICGIKENEDED